MPTVEVIGKSDQKRDDIEPEVTEKAQELGRALGILSHGHLVILTGGGSGYPFEVAMAAKGAGASVYAFSPTADFTDADWLATYSAGFLGKTGLEGLSGVVFLGDGLRVETISADEQIVRNRQRSEDMNDMVKKRGGTVLVVGGGSGTKREIADALRKSLSVGMLIGSGGIVDDLHNDNKKNLTEFLRAEGFSSETNGLLYFSAEPAALAQMALKRVTRK